MVNFCTKARDGHQKKTPLRFPYVVGFDDKRKSIIIFIYNKKNA